MPSLLRSRFSLPCALALLASGLVACDKDDPVSPQLATRYTLDRVNGSALPVALSSDPSDHTVLAGSLHFMSDARVARVLRVRTSAGMEETYQDTLGYGEDELRVWMTRPAVPADTIWGTVAARTFEFEVGTTAPSRYRYVVAR